MTSRPAKLAATDGLDWLARITAEAAPPLSADTIDRLRLVLAPKPTAEPTQPEQQRRAA